MRLSFLLPLSLIIQFREDVVNLEESSIEGQGDEDTYAVGLGLIRNDITRS